jgi:hypothetical protein
MGSIHGCNAVVVKAVGPARKASAASAVPSASAERPLDFERLYRRGHVMDAKDVGTVLGGE